jgi:hypothetical protein
LKSFSFSRKYDFQGPNQLEVCSDLDVNASKKIRLSRLDVAHKVVDIKAVLKNTHNKSEAARVVGVPRSTARYWLDREGKTGLSSEVESFFERPAGMAFLHQLTIAAQFAITQLAGGGVDIFASFLHLSQLDCFVASSHGRLHKQSVAMEEAINQFGTNEGKQLTLQMPKKKITLCQDETFHPEICLVAIEPVSNFIVLEEYSEKRDAEAWSKSMNTALDGLPVEVIQSTSDEGTGLVKYVEKELGAHHSSDLFHGQQEITRATSAPFRAKVKHAETEHEKSKSALARMEKEHGQHAANNTVPESWAALLRETIIAEANVVAASDYVREVKQWQSNVMDAKKALGAAYHPYDLNTGKAQTAEEISEKIEGQLSIIELSATNAELSENSMKRLEKARRVFNVMMATIVFFWTTVKRYVADLGLSPELECLMHDLLIPGLYLQLAAKKAKGATERKRIAKLATELLAHIDLCEAWCHLPLHEREKIRAVALQCAQLFQRSSSCVEGRNGYLSLRHHSSHRLSKRKLGALTILHNYFIKRPDGTTAAERFFASKPNDLFKYLLDNLDVAARPAKSRRASKMVA